MKNQYLSDYVADNLRACQLKQLSILEEVDRICRKHKLSYWLDAHCWEPCVMEDSSPGMMT